MLIEEFSFGNFRSFKDVNTLNMAAANIKSKEPELDTNNVIPLTETLDVLRSKAIYGANASGKSNVITALATFINIVKNSVKDETVFKQVEPFALSREMESRPSFFQLIFHHENVRYRYGFEANRDRVLSEWLFARSNVRETSLFIRDKSSISGLNKTQFEEADIFLALLGNVGKKQESAFEGNSLFLTNLASFGFAATARLIVQAISSINIISGLGDLSLMNEAERAMKDNSAKSFIISFLKHADFGIKDLDLFEFSESSNEASTNETKASVKKPKLSALLSIRNVYDENRELAGPTIFHTRTQESEGTKKIIELSPHIYKVLSSGGILVIDEFDARLHPLLTRKIVEIFNQVTAATAQLIFTTHDTNLLSADLIRRDQVDFVEKDVYGESHVYSLVQFKGIRNNASFEKDYMQGKYGAVPFLGDLTSINEEIKGGKKNKGH
ncbi:AAA family ATPase [Dyadobacter alkalitolerans]|uniref:AAA family ATPase n=1 Tax=Dyadobacter alkalitolerans TaxID=492736 RepID=UPI0004203C84|nr:ATP-binding protein [Dyadobacter alkalitolerans]